MKGQVTNPELLAETASLNEVIRSLARSPPALCIRSKEQRDQIEDIFTETEFIRYVGKKAGKIRWPFLSKVRHCFAKQFKLKRSCHDSTPYPRHWQRCLRITLWNKPLKRMKALEKRCGNGLKAKISFPWSTKRSVSH